MSSEDILRKQEAQRLLEQLRSHVAEERLQAAKGLNQLGIRTRGVVRTRGAMTRTASKPIQSLDLTPAMKAIDDAHWEVRRDVALALGEWGDEVALTVLERLMRSDSEWRVREAVAESLANIGGPRAVELLTEMVKTDTHPRPAERALKGLGDLALATWPDKLGSADLNRPVAVRTRGAMRVRGASPSKRTTPEADALLALLDEVRLRHPYPSVREVADDTLARLDER